MNAPSATALPPASSPDLSELRSFWSDTLRRARLQPLEAQVEEMTVPQLYRSFRIAYRSLDGVPIRAYLSIAGEVRAGTRLPAIVTAPGYGGTKMGVDLNEAQRGYIILQVYPRGQGDSGDLWKVDPAHQGDWIGCGTRSPEGSYYQGAYVDLVRGVDYLLTRDDVDPQRIGLAGTSQSGGMAIAVGGIDDRVVAVTAHVPYLCDMRRNAHFANRRDRDETFLRTFDHFDPLALAPWLRAPTLISAGGADPTSPADTIHAVFGRLGGIRSLVHAPTLTHMTSPDFYRMQWEWLDRYVKGR